MSGIRDSGSCRSGLGNVRKVIRATGLEEPISIKMSMASLRKLVAADLFDTVLLADRVHVMLVDDQGYSKELPVNEKATALYLERCYPGTTHQILGDVIVVPDDDFV